MVNIPGPSETKFVNLSPQIDLLQLTESVNFLLLVLFVNRLFISDKIYFEKKRGKVCLYIIMLQSL